MSFCAVRRGISLSKTISTPRSTPKSSSIKSVVGGRIVKLTISENAKVSKGNLLFRSDPVPYWLPSSRLKLIGGSPYALSIRDGPP